MTVQICKGRLIHRHYCYYYNVKSIDIFKGYLYLSFQDCKIEKIKLDDKTDYLIN